MGGRPRLGETKEEAYERRRKERELKEQELNQEPLPAAEPKTAVEPPENPINPLNDNVNEYEKLKENGYAKDNVDGETFVKDTDTCKGDDFFNSLIISDDFDNYDEDYSVREGTASAYLEGLLWKEQETMYRQSQGLEEEREPYI